MATVIQELLADYFTESEMIRALTGRGIKCTERTLRKWRQDRTGPPYVKIGRTILYSKPRFPAWLEARLQKPRRAA